MQLIFIGDSFVNGTGDEKYLGWSGRVAKALGGVTYYNLGVRGDSSFDILERWEREVACRAEVDAQLIFSFGVNDILQGVDTFVSCENLEAILIRAQKRFPKIIFVMPPPIEEEEINQKIEALITSYRALCEKHAIHYIDIFTALRESAIWMGEVIQNDGAHPYNEGYELFAKLVMKKLEKML